jgi:hypothetical protein
VISHLIRENLGAMPGGSTEFQLSMIGNLFGATISDADPLCGPAYAKPLLPVDIPAIPGVDLIIKFLTDHDVEWRDQNDVSIFLATKYPGVGDLYWESPVAKGDNSVGAANFDPLNNPSSNAKYKVQRERLIGCAATSLREVYEQGNHTFGELGVMKVAPSDPANDHCWEHWATNDSMLGAMGPVYARAFEGNVAKPPGLPVMWAVNTLLPLGLSSKSGIKLATDKDNYFLALADRLVVDSGTLVLHAAVNAALSSDGTESAHLVTATGKPISMLGVNPGTALDPPQLGQPPVYFSDRAQPRENDGPGVAHPEDHYVARMFWKSHLDEQACADFGAVEALAVRCKTAAGSGGDPEACTRCAELAEAWIPPVNNLGISGPSKCERLGHVPAGPSLWHSWAQREGNEDVRLTMEPFHAALSYCTGTEARFNTASGVGLGTWDHAQYGDHVVSDDRTAACITKDSQFGDVQQYAGDRRVRISKVVSEVHEDASRGSVPGPLVTNIETVLTVFGWDETCHTFHESTSQDSATAQWLAPLPYEHVGWNGGPEVRTADGPFGASVVAQELRACGLTQRVSYWNRACSALPQGLSLGATPTDSSYRPLDGVRVFEEVSTSGLPEDTRCSVLEARRVVPSCASGTCGASGLCRGGAAPTVVQFDRLFP